MTIQFEIRANFHTKQFHFATFLYLACPNIYIYVQDCTLNLFVIADLELIGEMYLYSTLRNYPETNKSLFLNFTILFLLQAKNYCHKYWMSCRQLTYICLYQVKYMTKKIIKINFTYIT